MIDRRPGPVFTVEKALQTYTPTWSGASSAPVLGNGTLLGNFVLDYPRLHLNVFLTIGSTTTTGTGAWGFTLPAGFASIAGSAQVLTAIAFDISTGIFYAIGWELRASQLLLFSGWRVDTAGAAAVGSADPFTWTVGDTLTISGTVLVTGA